MKQKLKNIAYFFYYSLYKFWTFVSGGNDLAFFQVGVSIIVLSMWLLWFGINLLNAYYSHNFYDELNIRHISYFIIIIYLIMDFIIRKKNNWNYYYYYFENLSKKEKALHHTITWFVILSIVIGFWSTLKWMRI